MSYVLRAFWHKSRKTFVPMTVNDLERKCGLDRQRIISALRRLCELKAVTLTRTNNHQVPAVWNLTDYGQHLATQMMQQQERIKL